MHTRAVFEAVADVVKKKIKVKPEIMISLVGFRREFDLQAEIVHRVAKEVMAEKKVKFDCLVGTNAAPSPPTRSRPGPSSSASARTTSRRPRSAFASRR
jgi:hypothetical protein